MAIDLFLAMTGAEIGKITPLPSKIAWMACHFSPYGTGLSNLPVDLPPGSVIIVNDRTPVCGHDPGLIAEQLRALSAELAPCGILLDFQRPQEQETAAIVKSIVCNPPCPVGVSEGYGKDLDCALFLPPVPLTTPVSEYLAPWQGREIWMDLAMDGLEITVTGEGSHAASLPSTQTNFPHRDTALACHYQIDLQADRVCFSLSRQAENLDTLLSLAESMGVTRAVGLYQELKRGCYL